MACYRGKTQSEGGSSAKTRLDASPILSSVLHINIDTKYLPGIVDVGNERRITVGPS